MRLARRRSAFAGTTSSSQGLVATTVAMWVGRACWSCHAAAAWRLVGACKGQCAFSSNDAKRVDAFCEHEC